MDRKKILLYILISFGFSWLVALVMLLADISIGSFLGIAMLALLYMPGPAIATFIIQKYIYKQGFREYGWKLEKKDRKYFLLVPLVFLGLLGFTFAAVALFGNTGIIHEFGKLDFTQQGFDDNFRKLVDSKMDMEDVEIPAIPVMLFLFASLAQCIFIGGTFNVPFMFGEEFGWRGLMLKETQSLGFLKSSIFIGVIWGLWHLPIILMGHNYPHHPYWGAAMMCLFTTAISPAFSYLRLKTNSILGPCMLHGMINASGALMMIYVYDFKELYSNIAGWAGVFAGVVVTVCIYVFDRKFILQSTVESRQS